MSKALALAIGIPALLLGGGVAFAVAKKSGALGPSVPIPSDDSLIDKYGVRNSKYGITNLAQKSLTSMRLDYPNETPSCSKGPTSSGALQTGFGVAAEAVDQIPLIGNFLGDAVNFIGAIFDHHAQAVAKEQATLCASSRAFNAAMDQFDQALTADTYSSSDAPAVYKNLWEKFAGMNAAVARSCPSPTATGSAAARGNEGCILNRIAQAILEKRLAQLGFATPANQVSVS